MSAIPALVSVRNSEEYFSDKASFDPYNIKAFTFWTKLTGHHGSPLVFLKWLILIVRGYPFSYTHLESFHLWTGNVFHRRLSEFHDFGQGIT